MRVRALPERLAWWDSERRGCPTETSEKDSQKAVNGLFLLVPDTLLKASNCEHFGSVLERAGLRGHIQVCRSTSIDIYDDITRHAEVTGPRTFRLTDTWLSRDSQG